MSFQLINISECPQVILYLCQSRCEVNHLGLFSAVCLHSGDILHCQTDKLRAAQEGEKSKDRLERDMTGSLLSFIGQKVSHASTQVFSFPVQSQRNRLNYCCWSLFLFLSCGRVPFHNANVFSSVLSINNLGTFYVFYGLYPAFLLSGGLRCLKKLYCNHISAPSRGPLSLHHCVLSSTVIFFFVTHSCEKMPISIP